MKYKRGDVVMVAGVLEGTVIAVREGWSEYGVQFLDKHIAVVLENDMELSKRHIINEILKVI